MTLNRWIHHLKPARVSANINRRSKIIPDSELELELEEDDSD